MRHNRPAICLINDRVAAELPKRTTSEMLAGGKLAELAGD